MADTAFDPGTGGVKPPKPEDQTTPTTPGESFDLSADVTNRQRTVGSGGAQVETDQGPVYGNAFKDVVDQQQNVQDAYKQAVNDFVQQPGEQEGAQPTGDQMAKATVLAGQPTQDTGTPPSGETNIMGDVAKGQELLAEGQPENPLDSYVKDIIGGIEGGIKESAREVGEAVTGQGQHVLGGGTGQLSGMERAAKILQGLGVTPALTALGTAFSPAQFAIGETLQNAVLVSPIRPRMENAFRSLGLDPYGTENPTARIELVNQVLMDAYLHSTDSGPASEQNVAAALLVANGYLQFVANGGLEMTATGVNLAKNLTRTAGNIAKAAARTNFATSEAGAANRLAAFKDDRLANLINEVSARDALVRPQEASGAMNPAGEVIPFVRKGEAAKDETVFPRDRAGYSKYLDQIIEDTGSRPRVSVPGEPTDLAAVREAKNKAPGQFEEKVSQLADESKGNVSKVDQERVSQGLPTLAEIRQMTQDVLAGKTKYKTVSEMLDDVQAKANRAKLTVVQGGAETPPPSPGAVSAPQFGRIPEVRSKTAIETNVRAASVEVDPQELVDHVYTPDVIGHDGLPGYSGNNRAKAFIMSNGEVRLLKPRMDHPEALTGNPAAAWTEGGGMRELARSGAARVYFDRTSVSVSIPEKMTAAVEKALTRLSRSLEREDPNLSVYVDIHDSKGKPIGESRTEYYDNPHSGNLIDAIKARQKEQGLINPGASIEFKSYKAETAVGGKEGGRFEPASGKIVINVPKPEPGFVQPFALRSVVAVTAHELTHALQWIFQARMDPDRWMHMNDIERLPSQVQETVLRLLGVPEEALGTGPDAQAFVQAFESKGLGGQIMDGLKKFVADETGRGQKAPVRTILQDYADKTLALRLSMPESTLNALADILRAQTHSPGKMMRDFFFGPQSERSKLFGPGAKDATFADNAKVIKDQLNAGKRRVTAEEMDALRNSAPGTESAVGANVPPPIRGSSEDANRSPLGGLTAKVFEKYQGVGGDNGLVKTIQQASGGRFRGVKDFGDAVKALDYNQLKGMPEQLVADFLTGYFEKGFAASGMKMTDDAIIAVAQQVAKSMVAGKEAASTDDILAGIRTVGDVERSGKGGSQKFAESMVPEEPSSLPPSVPGASGGKPEVTAPNDGSRGPGGISGVGTDGHPAVGQSTAKDLEAAVKETEADIAANPIAGGTGGGKRTGGGGASAGGPRKPGGPGPGAPKPTSVLIDVSKTGLDRSAMKDLNNQGQLKLDMPIEGGLPNSIGDVIKGINDFERSLMASSDASFTLNQGWYSMFTHQKEWGPAMIDQFKAMSSQEGFEKVNHEINQLPSIGLARRTRLALDNSNEFFQSKLIESLPGLGDVVAAGDRAYTAAGNSLRARIFDTFANAWGLMEVESKGITIGPEYDRMMKQANDLADWVNAITGVGTVSDAKWARLFADNQHMFFAAKFLASKVNIMTSPIAYLQQAARGSLPSRLKIAGRDMPMPMYLPPGQASSWRMVGQAWRDTVLYYGGIGVAMASLKAMGFDVGTDADADNFGTVKVGQTVFDLTGGTGKLFSLIWQTLGSKTHVTSSGRVVDLTQGKFGDEDSIDLWTRFLAGKLAPVYSQGFQMLKGKNFQKDQPTVWDLLPLPISAKQFIETFFDEQWKQHPEILLGALVNFLGAREYTTDTQSEPGDFNIGPITVPTGVLGTPVPIPKMPTPFKNDEGYQIPQRTR